MNTIKHHQAVHKVNDRGDSPTPQAQRKFETPTPGAEKLCQSSTPRAIIFKIQQKKNTKHETEIMKNSTEMLICSEILKQ